MTVSEYYRYIRRKSFYVIYRIYQKIKAIQIRHKKSIKVLFVVSDIGMWKTEVLYRRMLEHPRFNPILLPLPNNRNPHADQDVIAYFNQKGYAYTTILPEERIKSKIHPDIIFYQQPYSGFIEQKYFMTQNLNALICHSHYAFRNIMDKESIDMLYLNLPWQNYTENELTLKEQANLMTNKGRNLIATGMPVMDELTLDKSDYNDPWKPSSDNVKRIIYAPHHSIHEKDLLCWGTFLTYGESILELAKKYKTETQWVFKPHPALKSTLTKIWGEERTEKYYQEWDKLENAQKVEGRYIEIFKHSDAMIHDCGSFVFEYLYAHKPVMFLYAADGRKERVVVNQFSRDAKAVHYPGHSVEDIENFIQSVIAGSDPMMEEREDFYRKNLLPPNGFSASENIINCILGRK